MNPWGAVEAMLTHMLSTLLNVPTAHSPMFEACEIANADSGIVDPRMAAEAVSYTFLQCTLKGVQRSPRIVVQPKLGQNGLIDVTNVSCLVIPDRCIGIPTLAALGQGIPLTHVSGTDPDALPERRVTHVSGTDPDMAGDPGWIRTSDLQLRRLLLYPLSYGAMIRQRGTGLNEAELERKRP